MAMVDADAGTSAAYQGVEKRRERRQNKARKGEVGLAGMGGLPTNSQKAEFTHSLSLRDPAF